MKTYYFEFNHMKKSLIVRSSIEGMNKAGCYDYFTIRAKSISEAWEKASKRKIIEAEEFYTELCNELHPEDATKITEQIFNMSI